MPSPESIHPKAKTAAYGPALIADFVSRLPHKPGVYRMFDEHKNVLYVGKAKDLRKRVTAYTKYDRHTIRIQRMIRATVDMEFVICGSETEALLLEASLIKRLKPRYNILLRDDKSFPYILVRKTHPAAQITKHRGARNIKGDYYGPFASANSVNRTLDTLQRAFRLRNCSDSIYEARTRPCMLHQIKRCAAPCTGEVTLEEYDKLIGDAQDFLTGKSDKLRKRLQGQMSEASADLNYEKAAEYRDRLQAMAQVSTVSGGVNPETFKEGDVIGIHSEGGQSPKRGEKKMLIGRAVKNAQEALARKMAETASQQRLLKQVQEVFDLEEMPRRIEVYDNSHIQGTNAIGAFIVAGLDGFERKQYRTFNIKDVETEPGDDYGMMREVFWRRFTRLLKDDSLEWPDVVLIDGGKGQLSSVVEVLEELGIMDRTTLVAIAKGPDRNAGRETFFMPGRASFTLPPKTPALYYLQRLRDEAHRFAIGKHRAKRKKQMKKSPLDGIQGVGAARKKALLAHFGSGKAVKSASLEDLASVEGVSQKLAKGIYDYFNE